MQYTISYKNPATQYIPITATFNCAGKEELELQFPAWRPGRYELGNFAKNVKNFSVRSSDGKKVPFRKAGKDHWVVQTNNANEIVVSYAYYAAELNAGSTYMDDVQLYVNPVNCLIYVKDQQHLPCTASLKIPDNFELATGAKHTNNIISCADFHELVDSPFIASASLQHETYTVLGITFHLWFQGVATLDWEKLTSDFEKFTKLQIETFSDRKEKILGFPVKDYHFLFQIAASKTYHGVEHTTSTVIALGPGKDLMEGLYDDLLGVSSHELYHVWNIKSIRPQEMYPYDYSRENFSRLGYVAEGVTTYLGDVFLSAAHVKPFTWYKKELEKLLQRHFDNFGRFNYSVAESSWDTWLDGYVKGAPARKVSIYNEGALLAFVADMMIRKASGNKASIHDVMKHLYFNFARKNKGYTEQDYKDACEKYSGIDFTAFFVNHVNGTRPYESILVEALDTIGFTLEMEQNPKHDERILGIKTTEADGQTTILDIFPGSSAELGALMIGDVIVSINDTPVKNSIHETLEPFHDEPLSLKIDRKGREMEVVCPNTNRSMYPIYTIKKAKMPSNLSKRIFKSWIGYAWDECE